MTRISLAVTSSIMQIFTSAVLCTLWGLFAIAQLSGFQSTGRVSLLAFGVAETLIAFFFLFRTQPRTFSINPHEWGIAVLGSFLPLCLRPTSGMLLPVAELVVLLGATLQIAGVLSLNRSFALVPALRELKTEGMYRVVRHPIYLSYLISFSGYTVANFSISNLLVLLGTVSLLVARVYFEERHLSLTDEYRAYKKRIRWRLIPFVF